MRLTDIFETQFVPLRGRNRSPKTLKLYRHTLRQFSLHLGHEATLDDLTDIAVASYLSAYSPGRSPHTIERERVTLCALWRWCCRRGLLSRWPDIEPEKLPERVPEAWSAEQISRLFAQIRRCTGEIGIVSESVWWECLHWIAWDTGERITAILSVKRCDCRFYSNHATIICRAESRKGGKADRLYQVSSECAESIRAVITQHRDPLILPWPYSATHLWMRYTRLLQAAGLPSDRRSKFHRLRRSVASHLRAAGEDATAALDHKNANTTAAYIDPTIAPRKPIFETLFRPGENRERETAAANTDD